MFTLVFQKIIIMRNLLLFIFLLFSISFFSQNKKQSIGFQENKGQIIDQNSKPNLDVKFLLNTNGLNVQIKSNGFSYDIYETKKHPLTDKQKALQSSSLHRRMDKDKMPDYSLEYIYHRIDIDFVNSNPKVALIAEEKSNDYDHYYNVPDKPEGILMVHKYKQITYKNIYPNIDIVFSVPKDSLKAVEYNFVVHPGGKISDIQLKFKGAKTDLVGNKIKMNVRFGEMEESLPMSWTEDGKLKKEIAVGYTKIKKNVYGFATTENILGKKVVIDPVPTRLWGTFFGDETQNSNMVTFTTVDITTDSTGNVYLVGGTSAISSSYATSGAHQGYIAYGNPLSTRCGIVTKFDPNGNRLWGTYYGAIARTELTGIKIDSQNDVLVTGHTSSATNISTIGSFQPNLSLHGGGFTRDAMLVKFNSNGVRQWGTYFGGEGSDYSNALDIDNTNVYIVGATNSETNIAKNSNFQAKLNKTGIVVEDGFIACFNTDGNLNWSTYVGGDGVETFNTVVVKNATLIAAGHTTSYNNMTTVGVFREQVNNLTSNDRYGYVCKFSLDGKRIWGSYYGEASNINLPETIDSVELDNENNVYIGGRTSDHFNIATIDSFESSFPNAIYGSGFLAKLNSQGQRIWGTYIGGVYVNSIVFKNNSIYISGRSYLDLKAINICSYKPMSYWAGYIGKFTKKGAFVWGTTIGSYRTGDFKIALDLNSAIFAGGFSSKNDGIADANSYQPYILGNTNYFLMKFFEDPTIKIPQISSNTPVCVGTDLKLEASGGTNYSWTGPNGFSSTDQNPIIPNATAVNSGKYSCAITGSGSCDETKTIEVFVGDYLQPVPDLPILPIITGNCKTQITTVPTATDTCAGSITATTTSPLSYILPGTYTIIWNYDDGNGNIAKQSQTVVITSQPLPVTPTLTPQIFCIEQNATINEVIIAGKTIKWYDALTDGNLLASTTQLQNGLSYYASQTIDGCESDRITVVMNIQNTMAPTATSPQTICGRLNPTVNTILTTGTDLKWYDSATFGNLLPNTSLLQDGHTYYASQTINGCESTPRVAIKVALITTLPANNYEEKFCDDLDDGTEIVDLSSYVLKMVANTNNSSFTFYNSLFGAENETPSNKINNAISYKITLGENKIYLRINSNNGCYAVAELKLTLLSKPKINIEDLLFICEKNTLTVDAGPGFDHYSWSNGAITQKNTLENPGDFSITLTNDYLPITCSSTKKFTVKESGKPSIITIETNDLTDTENVITVVPTGKGDYEYSIDGFYYQDNNTFTGLVSGKYSIYVRDKNGCGIAISDDVFLLMFPKFFTPNGDGYNDTWRISFSDKEENLNIQIFDRFGKLLKIINSNTDSWNGTLNGLELPSADYWFVVKRSSGVEYKGHFSLKR